MSQNAAAIHSVYALCQLYAMIVLHQEMLVFSKREIMQGKRSGERPQWQPITQLSLIARHIDGMVESTSEQYATLLEARPKL